MGLIIVPSIPQPVQYAASGYGTVVFPANSALGDLVFTEDIDTQGQYDGTTFTVQKAGVYRVSGEFTPLSGRAIYVSNSVNGVDDAAKYFIGPTGTLTGETYTYVAMLNLNAGDTVKMRGYTTDVANVNVRSRICIERV